MPRRNTPKRARRANPGDDEDAQPIALGSITAAPPGWQARTVQPTNALKRYICPGCERSVEPGTLHLVAWPIEDESQRRHWHEHCWRAQLRSGRRPPT